MNDQLFEAIERMTEKGYSAEMIRRAAQLLKEMYTKKEGENGIDSTNRKNQAKS